MAEHLRFLYEVDCIIGGWQACGTIEDDDGNTMPLSYDSLTEAVADVVDDCRDIQQQVESGDRDAEDGFNAEDVRIRDAFNDKTYCFELRGSSADDLYLRFDDGRTVKAVGFNGGSINAA